MPAKIEKMGCVLRSHVTGMNAGAKRRAVTCVRDVSAPIRGRTETEEEPSPTNSGRQQSNFLVWGGGDLSSAIGLPSRTTT